MSGKPQGAGYKRSWKNYFLNLRYQLRFTLIMVAIAGVLFGALGFWVMKEAKSATKIGIGQIQGQGGALLDDPEKQIAHLKDSEARIGYVLFAIGVVLCAGLFVYGILMTHKVAGPLHKIGLYLDKVKAGKYDKVYNLRKGDQLVGFFDHFKQAHDSLRKMQERDVKELKEFLAAAEKHETLGKSAALEELRALIKTKEAGLV